MKLSLFRIVGRIINTWESSSKLGIKFSTFSTKSHLEMQRSTSSVQYRYQHSKLWDGPAKHSSGRQTNSGKTPPARNPLVSGKLAGGMLIPILDRGSTL